MPTNVPASAPVASTAPVQAPTVPQKAPSEPNKAPIPVSAPQDTWDVQEGGKTVKKSRKEIIDAYQLRQLSDKKRSEADKTLGEYNRLFEAYKKDPIKFMRATGVDFDNLATSYIAKKAEEAMLTPEVREANALKAENEQYKKYIEEQKTNKERLDKDAAIGIEREKIHAEIVQAIDEAKDLGMPIDEELVIAVAQKMILQDKKQQPLNAKEALPKAYQSTQKWLQGMASKMEGEALVNWLGKDVALKIRKYDLAQLKSKRASTAPQPSSLVKPGAKKEVKAAPYKTWSQFKAETLDKIQ